MHRPTFDAKEWEKLAEGKTVRRRERLDGPDRVLAALWSPASRDQLWLAIQDEQHYEVVAGYADEDLPGSTFAKRTLYQRIDLPWPFAARQWVIELESNRDLLAASQGTIWERHWRISERRGASIEDPDAVWVPETTGGWTLVEIAGGNLVIYHTRASVGGNIPDEAGTQWALMTVSGMVEEMDRRARDEVDAHYLDGHAPIERPDGTFVPFRSR
ncbi:MAG: hypothetical protein H6737_09215 [Alphaproteobacteria bacterium]|nr:hypothetical protein [Alphaproteobacteria bacterium]